VFEIVQAIRLGRINIVSDERGNARKSTRYSMKKAKNMDNETAESGHM
jgi:hypothetical protein